MPTFYCPTCGYNLTGLPENRCPECGNAFDPAALESENDGSFKPIELRELLLRILWPPGAFLFASAAAIPAKSIGIFIIIMGGIFLFVFGLINARKLGRRLAANRALQQGRTASIRSDRRFIASVSAGLWFCQLFIGFGGCAAVVATLALH